MEPHHATFSTCLLTCIPALGGRFHTLQTILTSDVSTEGELASYGMAAVIAVSSSSLVDNSLRMSLMPGELVAMTHSLKRSCKGVWILRSHPVDSEESLNVMFYCTLTSSYVALDEGCLFTSTLLPRAYAQHNGFKH
jgi:hypothetical protein